MPNPFTRDPDLLEDTPPSGRKYTRQIPVSVEPEMYDLIRDLAHHPDLPFNGNMAAFGRRAFRDLVTGTQKFLADDRKSLQAHLRGLQRRLSAERYVVSTDEMLDTQATNFKVLTTSRDWSWIEDDLEQWIERLNDMPPRWRRMVASRWNRHEGLETLVSVWAREIHGDDPATWARVQGLLERITNAADA